jgi:hypothetical protein
MLGFVSMLLSAVIFVHEPDLDHTQSWSCAAFSGIGEFRQVQNPCPYYVSLLVLSMTFSLSVHFQYVVSRTLDNFQLEEYVTSSELARARCIRLPFIDFGN